MTKTFEKSLLQREKPLVWVKWLQSCQEMGSYQSAEMRKGQIVEAAGILVEEDDAYVTIDTECNLRNGAYRDPVHILKANIVNQQVFEPRISLRSKRASVASETGESVQNDKRILGFAAAQQTSL